MARANALGHQAVPSIICHMSKTLANQQRLKKIQAHTAGGHATGHAQAHRQKRRARNATRLARTAGLSPFHKTKNPRDDKTRPTQRTHAAAAAIRGACPNFKTPKQAFRGLTSQLCAWRRHLAKEAKI
ncbi:hypothetical protein HMPREF1640_02015 [Prevotella sp. S7-1-8]|jgi:hypothetical protein|nr:hypothetical protein HMPREF1640_02015 [Prevotella sp. S7-1-8]